jgi:hypothetical protein
MSETPSNELKQILEEIEERANKASEGPWRFERHWGPYNWQGAILHDTTGVYNCTVLPLETCTPEKDANGSFMASARTDVPALVKALRRADNFIALFRVPETPHPSDIEKSAWKCTKEITAILNQERSVGDNKGSAA